MIIFGWVGRVCFFRPADKPLGRKLTDWKMAGYDPLGIRLLARDGFSVRKLSCGKSLAGLRIWRVANNNLTQNLVLAYRKREDDKAFPTTSVLVFGGLEGEERYGDQWRR
jgi:hypothetical protein